MSVIGAPDKGWYLVYSDGMYVDNPKDWKRIELDIAPRRAIEVSIGVPRALAEACGLSLPEGLYICNPKKNLDCRKTHCFLAGGECYMTSDIQLALSLEDLVKK